MFQPVETVAGGWGEYYLVQEIGKIEDRRCGDICPVGRVQVGALLQHELHGGHGPGQNEVGVGTSDT